jgi:hypothetical protein
MSLIQANALACELGDDELDELEERHDTEPAPINPEDDAG